MRVSEEEVEELVAFLKILTDRNRLRILGLLSEKEYTVKDLAAALEVKEPTVSAHLNMLKVRGLLKMREQGTSHYYSIRQESVYALLQEIAKANKEIEEDPNSSEFERQVLKFFFVDGKLKQIPVKQSKLLVVLRRLVEAFRYGEFYTEKQVSETLKQFHPDFASLRRYLIDFRFMARENGRYWRVEPDVSR